MTHPLLQDFSLDSRHLAIGLLITEVLEGRRPDLQLREAGEGVGQVAGVVEMRGITAARAEDMTPLDRIDGSEARSRGSPDSGGGRPATPPAVAQQDQAAISYPPYGIIVPPLDRDKQKSRKLEIIAKIGFFRFKVRGLGFLSVLS